MDAPYPPLLLRRTRVERTYTGGRLLDEWQGILPGVDGRFPESWIASTLSSRYDPDPLAGLSFVEGPVFRGSSLRDLVVSDPEGFLGVAHAGRYGAELGYLTKIIDSEDRLNVQTHPGREKARELFGSEFGKTEAWFVIGGRRIGGEDPYILLGFRPGITRDRWTSIVDSRDRRAIAGALNRLPIAPGDVFLVNSGVPHAIGSGCLIAEIQEPTDITFRVERMSGPSGPYPDEVYHQGAGFERMFDCFEYEGHTEEEMESLARIRPRLLERGSDFERWTLIGPGDTPFFGMERLRIRDSYELKPDGSFASAVVLSGSGSLEGSRANLSLGPSSELFLPWGTGGVFSKHGDTPELDILVCRPPRTG